MQPTANNDPGYYNATKEAADFQTIAARTVTPPVGPIRATLDEHLHNDAAEAASALQREYGPAEEAKAKGKRGRHLNLEHPEASARRDPTMGLTMVQAAFLVAFRLVPSGPRAARAAGVSISSVERWRNDDPVFRQAYGDAYEAARGALFSSMWSSAIEGDVEPVYQGGALVGYKRKFSDRMRELLAKGMMPEMFARKELQGRGVTVNIKATPEQIAEVVRRLSPTRQKQTIEAETIVERQPSGNCGQPPV